MDKHEIKHKHEEEAEDAELVKKQQKSSSKLLFQMILFIVLIIIIILASKNISELNRETPNLEFRIYNGFNCTSYLNFTNCMLYIVEEQQWYDFEFRSAPWQLEDIPVEGNLDNLVNWTHTQKIYIVFPGNLAQQEENPKMAIATYQVGRFFGDLFEYKIPAKAGILKGTDIHGMSPNTPEIDCENATNGTSVIIFQYGDENRIVQEGDCYNLYGKNPDELIRVADRMTFTFLGVMQETRADHQG